MLSVGKLDSDLLKKIVFEKITFQREEVFTRPGIGEDCATIDFGEYQCVMSTDPITAAVEDIGRLAVNISCNDIASNGVEPLGLMLAVMLPVGIKEKDVEKIMKQAGEASEKLGVEIIGGHTEITAAVNQPVIVSTAVGRGKRIEEENLMKPGDSIYMTKSAGIEGAAILAKERKEFLLEHLTEEEIEKGKSFMEDVSVVEEGVAAGKLGIFHMHDVTEGGILGAVWETAHVGNLGVKLIEERIPVEAVVKKICTVFDINPLRLISSGSMIMVVRQEQIESLEKVMAEKNIPLAKIGEMVSKEMGMTMKREGGWEEIVPPSSDELYIGLKEI